MEALIQQSRLRRVRFLRECSRRTSDAEREGMRADCKRTTVGISLEGRRTGRIYYSNGKPTPVTRRNLLLKYAFLLAVGIAIRRQCLAGSLFYRHISAWPFQLTRVRLSESSGQFYSIVLPFEREPKAKKLKIKGS